MAQIALVLWFFLLTLSPALAERRVALVIGIDRYDNLGPQAQLRKARGDAAAVARLLKDIGFDVIAKEDLTRSAFNSHWQDFLNKLMPGDSAAVYFAGHGVEFAGRSYLLPRDVPNLKPGRDELLRREALSLQEFLADLREKGTRLNLVILDACRDNPFEQGAGRSVGSRRGLAVTEPPPEGTFIMYSAGAGESALDQLSIADRDPNSVYTRHLLPLLKTPGMSLTEVAEQVRVLVRQMAETVQHRQTPAYYNQVLGRVCLAGGECGTRVAGGEAAEAWDRTKDTTSIPVLDAFIRRFGDTYYGDLARVKLAELKQAEAAKKKEEEAIAKEEAERQRLAMLKVEQGRKQIEEIERQRLKTEEDRKGPEEEKTRAEAAAKRTEVDRKQLAALKQEEQKNRAHAASAKQTADAELKKKQLVLAPPAPTFPTQIPSAQDARNVEGPWNGRWSGLGWASGTVITIVANRVVAYRRNRQRQPVTNSRAEGEAVTFSSGTSVITMRLQGPGRATLHTGRGSQISMELMKE
jgi:uncharacterized caspase-like protein